MRVIKIDLLLWWEDDSSGNSELWEKLAITGRQLLPLGRCDWICDYHHLHLYSPCTVKNQTQGLIHVRPVFYYWATLLAPHILRYQPLLYILTPQLLHPCKCSELKESCSWSRCSLKDSCSRSILIWEGYCEFIFYCCNKIHWPRAA